MLDCCLPCRNGRNAAETVARGDCAGDRSASYCACLKLTICIGSPLYRCDLIGNFIACLCLLWRNRRRSDHTVLFFGSRSVIETALRRSIIHTMSKLPARGAVAGELWPKRATWVPYDGYLALFYWDLILRYGIDAKSAVGAVQMHHLPRHMQLHHCMRLGMQHIAPPQLIGSVAAQHIITLKFHRLHAAHPRTLQHLHTWQLALSNSPGCLQLTDTRRRSPPPPKSLDRALSCCMVSCLPALSPAYPHSRLPSLHTALPPAPSAISRHQGRPEESQGVRPGLRP